jgi:hypothetical protein
MAEEQNKTGDQNEKPVKAKGKVTVEVKASFELDEEKLQCLHKEGLTVTTVTVN